LEVEYRKSDELEGRLLASLVAFGTPRETKHYIARTMTKQDFYGTEHQMIYEAAVGLLVSKGEFTWAQLKDDLGALHVGDKELVDIAKDIYINGAPLEDPEPGEDTLSDVMGRLRAYAQARAAQKASITVYEDMKARAWIDIAEEIAACGSKMLAIAEGGSDKEGDSNDSLALQVIAEAVSGDTSSRFKTSIQAFDSLLHGGLAPATLTVIGGRRGTGKSAFGVHLLAQAIFQSKQVALVALEMSRKQMMARLMSSVSGVRMSGRNGSDYSDTEMTCVGDARKAISAGNPIIIDKPMSIDQIEATAGNLAARGLLDILIVDYLQLVSFPKAENQQVGLTNVALGLKRIGLRHGIPVVAMAQVRREVQGDRGSPSLAGLKGSGSIEEAADHVLLVSPRRTDTPEEIECFLAKNRHGETGTFHLSASWKVMRLFEAGPAGGE